MVLMMLLRRRRRWRRLEFTATCTGYTNFGYTRTNTAVLWRSTEPPLRQSGRKAPEQIIHFTLGPTVLLPSRATLSAPGGNNSNPSLTSKKKGKKQTPSSKNATWWWTSVHTELFLQVSQGDNFAARTCPPLLPSSIGDDISEPVLGNGKTYVTLP